MLGIARSGTAGTGIARSVEELELLMSEPRFHFADGNAKTEPRFRRPRNHGSIP